MSRCVVISGLGPVSGLGLGIEALWEAVTQGRSAVAPISVYDASNFACRIAAAVPEFKVRDYVPKSYRKATKVMARDIELAVVAADFAARDAGLKTPATRDDDSASYAPERVGCHIGAGLIAADLTELTAALVEACGEDGSFDIARWGAEGMNHLTPLWLLKYLPNMLACHVTIIHDTQGPSNTITCAEASANLSIGESFRVIQRGAADACFCGGMESKLHPVTLLRQQFTGRLNSQDNDNPAGAVRPLCKTAAGTAPGEGGGIVILEAIDTHQARTAGGQRAYCELLGFGAAQDAAMDGDYANPSADGRAIAAAIRKAMRDADVSSDDIDLIVPVAAGVRQSDDAEAAALRDVFGDRLADVPIATTKSMVGACGAGLGGIDIAVAAMALREQVMPGVINCPTPLDGLRAGNRDTTPAEIRHALTYSFGLGGQNAAVVLGRLEGVRREA